MYPYVPRATSVRAFPHVSYPSRRVLSRATPEQPRGAPSRLRAVGNAYGSVVANGPAHQSTRAYAFACESDPQLPSSLASNTLKYYPTPSACRDLASP